MNKRNKCPYCGADIDYKHRLKYVRNKGRDVSCIKCGKLMSLSYRKTAFFMGAIFFAGLVAMNTFYLFFTKNRTVIPNLILTMALIVLYLMLVPVNVRFKKIAGQEEEQPKLKKNRHRHKKDKKQKITFDENPLENTTFDR